MKNIMLFKQIHKNIASIFFFLFQQQNKLYYELSHYNKMIYINNLYHIFNN